MSILYNELKHGDIRTLTRYCGLRRFDQTFIYCVRHGFYDVVMIDDDWHERHFDCQLVTGEDLYKIEPDSGAPFLSLPKSDQIEYHRLAEIHNSEIIENKKIASDG